MYRYSPAPRKPLSIVTGTRVLPSACAISLLRLLKILCVCAAADERLPASLESDVGNQVRDSGTIE